MTTHVSIETLPLALETTTPRNGSEEATARRGNVTAMATGIGAAITVAACFHRRVELTVRVGAQ